MSKKNLFSEFEAVSAKAFKQKIQMDLKGADFNQTLLTHTREGIDVKPFYHRDTVPNTIPITNEAMHWTIGEPIYIANAETANGIALKAVRNGAEALHFSALNTFKIEALFQNISQEIPIYLSVSFLNTSFVQKLLTFTDTNKYTLYLNCDVIAQLAGEGNWYSSLREDLTFIKWIAKEKNTGVLTVDGTLYQNAGANAKQELAYILAHACEYYHLLDKEKNLPKQLVIKLAIGTDYFMEIAKFRALRLLFNTLDSVFNTNTNLHIVATPSFRNKTVYEYNMNMLRTTTECMSAVIGGVDAVVNTPYDALYHKTNEFGQRIARNQLIILKEESYFDGVSNPAAGSYYIESLTVQLAEKALSLFKSIESGGGFLKQLKAGIIQKKLKESHEGELQDFKNKDRVLIGANVYINKEDEMQATVDLYPFFKRKPRKTLIEPIIPRRLAEPIEKTRFENEAP